MKDLEEQVDFLRISFNDAIADKITIHILEGIRESVSALERTATSLLHTSERSIRNVVDTARERVSSALFPVKDFLHAL